MTDRRVPHGGGLVIGLILSLVLWIVLATAAHAQGILPASTGCVGEVPTTLFRADIQRDSLAKAELDSHESVHRAQLDSIIASSDTLGCYEALMYMTSSPEINLSFEVPAYKAQADWNHAHRMGFNYRDFFMVVSKSLVFSYDSRIPWGQIFTRLYGLDREEPWGQTTEPMSHVFSETGE